MASNEELLQGYALTRETKCSRHFLQTATADTRFICSDLRFDVCTVGYPQIRWMNWIVQGKEGVQIVTAFRKIQLS